jgi:hypothetical protein
MTSGRSAGTCGQQVGVNVLLRDHVSTLACGARETAFQIQQQGIKEIACEKVSIGVGLRAPLDTWSNQNGPWMSLDCRNAIYVEHP